MTYINGINRQQIILFPEVLDDYISEDNPVRFIDKFVNTLDLNELVFDHSPQIFCYHYIIMARAFGKNLS